MTSAYLPRTVRKKLRFPASAAARRSEPHCTGGAGVYGLESVDPTAAPVDDTAEGMDASVATGAAGREAGGDEDAADPRRRTQFTASQNCRAVTRSLSDKRMNRVLSEKRCCSFG
mmetsp:Transcript_37264/g.55717  ORF Transcript_37264/g.55717 Transcript_37264/m.55717 type:complete len:115 (-) Transcript_37264:427-771(-)